MRRLLGMTLGVVLSTALSAHAYHPDVDLKDQNGRPVSESHLPVDYRKSCGSCHDVDFIATAYHFQQGRLALLDAETYKKNYYDRYGKEQFTNGLPEELTSLDMGMYGKL